MTAFWGRLLRLWHWLVFAVGVAMILRFGALCVDHKLNEGTRPPYAVTTTVKSPDGKLAAVVIERWSRDWLFDGCRGEVRKVPVSALGRDLSDIGDHFVRSECGIFEGDEKTATLEWFTPTRLRIAINTESL